MSNTNVYIKNFAFDEIQQKVNNVSFNLDLEDDFTLNDKTLITKAEADQYITDKWSDWINSNGDIWAYKAWNTLQSGSSYYRMRTEPYILLTRQLISSEPANLEDQKKVIALIGLNKNTSYTNAKTFLYNKSTENMFWIGNRNVYDGSTFIGDRVIRMIINGINRDIVITPNESAVKVVNWRDY